MLNNLDSKNIILASKSPRRQELLLGLDIHFSIEVREVEEVYPSNLAPEEVPVYLASLKAKAFEGELTKNDVLITADTIVILGTEILEKPKYHADAVEMIAKMSGKTHTVVTGVCVSTLNNQVIFSDHTMVTFAQLSTQEIEYYVSKYKPFDKAGAYGVQEWIGYIAIEKLEGSYYNVMGLPLHKLYAALKKID